MKWPVIHVPDAKALARFIEWAAHANIGSGIWLQGNLTPHVALLHEMTDQGIDVFIQHPRDQPRFNRLPHPVGMTNSGLTPLNSLSHLARYLAQCQAKA